MTEFILASALPKANLPLLSLPFSPFKLVLLIAWVYFCLYLVQYVEFSPLVDKQRKTLGKIVTLLTGPLFILSIIAVNAAKTAASSGMGIAEAFQEQFSSTILKLKSTSHSIPSDSEELRLFDSNGTDLMEVFDDKKSRGPSPVTRLTIQIIDNALKDRASDILIDPKDSSNYTVRYRVDGVLKVAYTLKTELSMSVISSIKVISTMDIAEKRRPQDGSFSASSGDDLVSFRVASAGVLNGEKLSIRVLNQNADKFSLKNIGLSRKQQMLLDDAIRKPSGMILICGPTGSGKTTSMYAMLNMIDRSTRNVITIEDPIEYALTNASQIEVNAKAGITFAKSLRSILRQDPDVICVGEIRDEETAKIALQASQTGHLVLATVHSISNAAALLRLVDLGVSPMLISSGLDIVISQRLLRKLCDNCKQTAHLSKKQIYDFQKRKVNYLNINDAVGCEACDGTGYYERIAVCDILPLTNDLKDTIANNPAFITELRKGGDKKGRSNLKKQALKKVVTGVTTLEELKRVLG